MMGRAGMDVFHIRHGENGTRADRKALLEEAMRELDEDWIAKQAGRNNNVIAALSKNNIAMVNTGDGGFRRCHRIEDVLDYGDAREAKVKRKIKSNSFSTTTIVAMLPKSMCVDHEFTDSEGRTKTRYVSRDEVTMRRYFHEVLAYLGDDVLTGGQEAIHGYDINLDETTPHIQVMCDTFAPHPMDPDFLRVEASQMWGSHRDVRYPDGHEKVGQQIGGSVKMENYQRGLREHMVAVGFPVELEVSERSNEKLDKQSFVELEEKRAALAEDQVEVEDALEEAYAIRRKAKIDGYEKGLEEGLAESATATRKAEEAKRLAEAANYSVETHRRLLEEERRSEAEKLREFVEVIAELQGMKATMVERQRVEQLKRSSAYQRALAKAQNRAWEESGGRQIGE